jgi:hypothetical protein
MVSSITGNLTKSMTSETYLRRWRRIQHDATTESMQELLFLNTKKYRAKYSIIRKVNGSIPTKQSQKTKWTRHR